MWGDGLEELALDMWMLLCVVRFSMGGVPGGAAGVNSGSSGSEGTAVRMAEVVAAVGLVESSGCEA